MVSIWGSIRGSSPAGKFSMPAVPHPRRLWCLSLLWCHNLFWSQPCRAVRWLSPAWMSRPACGRLWVRVRIACGLSGFLSVGPSMWRMFPCSSFPAWYVFSIGFSVLREVKRSFVDFLILLSLKLIIMRISSWTLIPCFRKLDKWMRWQFCHRMY